MAEGLTGAWHSVEVGTVLTGDPVTVTDDLVQGLVELGGFVHPLFTDPDYVRDHSPLPGRPLPGTALLHLMGGLAEQSGVLDGTVLALLGFGEVAFAAPAMVGDRVRLELEIGATTPTSKPGREVLELSWRAVRDPDGAVLARAVARMLVQRPPAGSLGPR